MFEVPKLKEVTGVQSSQLLTTVEENKTSYTNHQIQAAKWACWLYHAIGTPTVENFRSIIRSNMIKHFPVIIEDINISEDLFGKDVSYIKGKMTRTAPKPVVNDNISIPNEIKF